MTQSTVRISAVDPSLTTGHVKDLLDGVQKGLGVTPNMFRVAAQSPATLEALVSLFGTIGKGRLGAKVRESIALTVSEIDACDYCLSAHSALGKGAGLSDQDIERARQAQATDPKSAAAVKLARHIVERRGRVNDDTVSDARAAGLNDAEILEVVANVALTTFTNYLNEVAGTEIDFPHVHHAAR